MEKEEDKVSSELQEVASRGQALQEGRQMKQIWFAVTATGKDIGKPSAPSSTRLWPRGGPRDYRRREEKKVAAAKEDGAAAEEDSAPEEKDKEAGQEARAMARAAARARLSSSTHRSIGHRVKRRTDRPESTL